METLKHILENTWVQRGVWSFFVVMFSGLVYRVVTKFLTRKEKQNTKILSQKKNRTLIRMIKSIIGYALAIVTILMVLQIYGVDVTSMLAGVGIASIIIGFALQDALKDIFRGFDIVSDGYYEIGDVITFGENTGQVLSINLRTTKIQDINTMNIVSIANRNIDRVEVVSNAIYFNMPMPRELSVEKAEEILKSTLKEIKKDENVTNAELLGLNKITDTGFEYLFSINCDATVKLATRRKALRVIVRTLEDNKISIPFNQLEIRNKK